MRILIMLTAMMSLNVYGSEPLVVDVPAGRIKIAGEIPIRVTNTTDRDVDFISVKIYKIGINGEKVERANVGCPCDAKCKRRPILLRPEESRVYTWDFKDNKCRQVMPGDYVVKITGGWSDKTGAISLLGRSRTFNLLK